MEKKQEPFTTDKTGDMGDLRKRHALFFKSISLVLILTFTWQQVAYAQGGAPVWQHAKLQGTEGHGLSIPYASGSIEKEHSNGSERLIINIQDAHSSLSAQHSIVNILDSLVSNYDLNLVAVEGSEGYIDTSILRTFPDKKIRRETADYLMKKGKMSAGEFFTVIAEKPITLYGIENNELYKKNVEAFKGVIKERAVAVKNAEALERALNKLAERVYNKRLRGFNEKSRQHKEGTLSFSEYWKYASKLAEKSNVKVENYANISKLLRALDLESEINFSAANAERKKLIDELSNRLKKSKLEKLVLSSLAFKKNEISQGAFHQLLVDFAKEKKIDPAPYKNLINFTQYISLYESINIFSLFDEVERLEGAIREKLFKNADERILYDLKEKTRILKNLFKVNLDNGDVDYLIARRNEFRAEAFASFIRKNYKKYGLALEGDYDLSLIMERIDEAADFYSIAKRRDEEMLKNTLRRMKDEGQSVAALITGGFHTKGLAGLMKNKGLSYLVVMPKYQDGEERPYVAVLTGKANVYEELVKSGKYELAVHQYFSTGNIDNLKDSIAYALKSTKGKRDLEETKRIWSANYKHAYESLPKEKAEAVAGSRITPEEFNELLNDVTEEKTQNAEAYYAGMIRLYEKARKVKEFELKEHELEVLRAMSYLLSKDSAAFLEYELESEVEAKVTEDTLGRYAANIDRLSDQEKNILMWAALLHDSAKNDENLKGRPHPEEGAKIAEKVLKHSDLKAVLKKDGLSDEDVDLIVWLVKYHDVFGNIDTGERVPSFLLTMVDELKSETNRKKALTFLQFMMFCDIRGTKGNENHKFGAYLTDKKGKFYLDFSDESQIEEREKDLFSYRVKKWTGNPDGSWDPGREKEFYTELEQSDSREKIKTYFGSRIGYITYGYYIFDVLTPGQLVGLMERIVKVIPDGAEFDDITVNFTLPYRKWVEESRTMLGKLKEILDSSKNTSLEVTFDEKENSIKVDTRKLVAPQTRDEKGQFNDKPGGSTEDIFNTIVQNNGLLALVEEGKLSVFEYRDVDTRVSEETNIRDFEQLARQDIFRPTNYEKRAKATYGLTSKGYQRLFELFLANETNPTAFIKALIEDMEQEKGPTFHMEVEALTRIMVKIEGEQIEDLVMAFLKFSHDPEIKEAAAIVLSQWCGQPHRAEKARSALRDALGERQLGIFDAYGVWVIDTRVEGKYKFTAEDLDRIGTALSMLPRQHVTRDVVRVILRTDPDECHEDVPGWLNETEKMREMAERVRVLGTYDPELRIARVNETQEIERTIFHEVGHGVYFNLLGNKTTESFGSLYADSMSRLPAEKQRYRDDVDYGDFAYPYGAVNKIEDFATIYESLIACRKLLVRKASRVKRPKKANLLFQKISLMEQNFGSLHVAEELGFDVPLPPVDVPEDARSEAVDTIESIKSRTVEGLKKDLTGVVPLNESWIGMFATDIVEKFFASEADSLLHESNGFKRSEAAIVEFAEEWMVGAKVVRVIAKTISPKIPQILRRIIQSEIDKKTSTRRGPPRGIDGKTLGILLAMSFIVSGCSSVGGGAAIIFGAVFVTVTGAVLLIRYLIRPYSRDARRPEVQALVKRLGKGPDEAIEAAEALGKMGYRARAASHELLISLKDEDGKVREASVRTLGQAYTYRGSLFEGALRAMDVPTVGKKEVVEALIAKVSDQKTSVRLAAVIALGKMGPDIKTAEPFSDRTIARLKMGLTSSDMEARKAAHNILEIIDTKDKHRGSGLSTGGMILGISFWAALIYEWITGSAALQGGTYVAAGLSGGFAVSLIILTIIAAVVMSVTRLADTVPEGPVGPKGKRRDTDSLKKDVAQLDITDVGSPGTHDMDYRDKLTRHRIRTSIEDEKKFLRISYSDENNEFIINETGDNASGIDRALTDRLRALERNTKLQEFLKTNKHEITNLRICLLEPSEKEERTMTHPHLLTARGKQYEVAVSGTNDGREQAVYMARAMFADPEVDTRLLADILINQISLAIVRYKSWHRGIEFPFGDANSSKMKKLMNRVRRLDAVKNELAAAQRYDMKLDMEYTVSERACESIVRLMKILKEKYPDFAPAVTNYERALKFKEDIENYDYDSAIKWWGLITYEFRELMRGVTSGSDASNLLQETETIDFLDWGESINVKFNGYILAHGIYNQEGEEHGEAVGPVRVISDIDKIDEALAGAKGNEIWVIPYLPFRRPEIPGAGCIISIAGNRHAMDTAKEQAIPLAVVPNAAELLKDFDGQTGMLRVSRDRDVRFRHAFKNERGDPRKKEPVKICVPEAKPGKKLIYQLEDVDENLVNYVGSKAANLGKMIGAGINVPEGFVLSFAFWKRFAEHNGLDEKIDKLSGRIDEEELLTKEEELQKVLRQIKDLIINGEVPEDLKEELLPHINELRKKYGHKGFYVRSSFNFEDLTEKTTAGHYDSYPDKDLLNTSSDENILKAIKMVFASKWNEIALAERINEKIGDNEVTPAVIIQTPVKARFAGTMYTANPYSYSFNEVAIMASHGQGAAVVGERGRPAEAIVDKITGEIKAHTHRSYVDREYRVVNGEVEFGYVTTEEREERIITPELAKKLKDLGDQIETIYDFRPQDIEWCVDGEGNAWIVQTRPMITEQLPTEKIIDDEALKKLNASGNEEDLIALKKAQKDMDFETLLGYLQLDKTCRELTAPYVRDKSDEEKAKIRKEATKAHVERFVSARLLLVLADQEEAVSRITLDMVQRIIDFLKRPDSANLDDALSTPQLLAFLLKAGLNSEDEEVKTAVRDFFMYIKNSAYQSMFHAIGMELAKALVVYVDHDAAINHLRGVDIMPDVADKTIRILGTIPTDSSIELLEGFCENEHVPLWVREFALRMIDQVKRDISQKPKVDPGLPGPGSVSVGLLAAVTGISGVGAALAAISPQALAVGILVLCVGALIGAVALYVRTLLKERREKTRKREEYIEVMNKLMADLREALRPHLSDEEAMEAIHEILLKNKITDPKMTSDFMSRAVDFIKKDALSDIPFHTDLFSEMDPSMKKVRELVKYGATTIVAETGEEFLFKLRHDEKMDKQDFTIFVETKRTGSPVGRIDVFGDYASFSFDSAYRTQKYDAVEVYEKYRNKYKGIGRTLVSIAMGVAKSRMRTRFKVLISRNDDFYWNIGFERNIKDTRQFIFDLESRPLPEMKIEVRKTPDIVIGIPLAGLIISGLSFSEKKARIKEAVEKVRAQIPEEIEVVFFEDKLDEVKNLKHIEDYAKEVGAKMAVPVRRNLSADEVAEEIESGFLGYLAADLFKLLNPELSEIDETRASLMTEGELKRISGKLSKLLPNIVSEKLIVLSIYSMNIRIENSVRNIIDNQEESTEAVKASLKDGSGKKALVVKARSLGAVKLTAEAHREKMKQLGFKRPEEYPVKLKIAFDAENAEELEKLKRNKKEFLAQMKVGDILDVEDLVLDGTASEICKDLIGQEFKPENIAVIDELKKSRNAGEVPEKVLLIEYRDGIITPETYSMALEIIARRGNPEDLEVYLKGAGIVTDGANPLRFILPRVKRYDVKQLRNEADQYHKVVIMA